ncbi:uncharacterized protein BP5553_05415 [Venustampulla echinocandica]|uniref:C2H2-type domain-containing protein n=1 Tax=Venustampulla echinocandica TaxID=2656787 RepID=A0A370TR34_9HELO|nr:uncharacterized protein BP5553_05415 [Venustampulla echinocandica]RDL37982.1 hypothetical protein BP5553_05415 [Venustampulla echinocandica]
MDPNGFYSFDQNALWQPAVTDLFEPPTDNNEATAFGGHTSFYNEFSNSGAVGPSGFAPNGNGISDENYSMSSHPLQPPATNACRASVGQYSDIVGTDNSLLSNWSAFLGTDPETHYFAQNTGDSHPQQTSIRPTTDIDYSTSTISNNNATSPALYPFNHTDPSLNYVLGPDASMSGDFQVNGSYSFNQINLGQCGWNAVPKTPCQPKVTPNALSAPRGLVPGSSTHADLVPSISDTFGIPPQRQFVGQPIMCDWPACTLVENFVDAAARSCHITIAHIEKVRDDTSGACTWPGCKSKLKFPTKARLNNHIDNIHVDPLRCLVPGCKRKLPFERKGDLERHIATVHERRGTWKCPQQGCPRHYRGFSRTDKLREHARSQSHSTLYCPYDHCYFNVCRAFMTDAEVSSHCRSHHAEFECGIGSCANSNSCFDEKRFQRHIANHIPLGYRYDPLMQAASMQAVQSIIEQFKQTQQTRFTEAHFGDLKFEQHCVQCG